MRLRKVGVLLVLPVLALALACSQRNGNQTSYKDQVKQALQQADLKDVTVDEDKDENTITLGGKVSSENSKAQAGNIAQAAAANRVIANEISVQPAGAESQAKDIAANVDDGIEDNYKAALIAKGLNQQHIRYDAKNGVLTLKGSVKSAPQRQEAEQLAQAVPNVQQVVDQLEVKR